jgi:hypothetical protein
MHWEWTTEKETRTASTKEFGKLTVSASDLKFEFGSLIAFGCPSLSEKDSEFAFEFAKHSASASDSRSGSYSQSGLATSSGSESGCKLT